MRTPSPRRLVALLPLVLAFAHVDAQGTQTLTLEQAEQMAIANHPEVRASQALATAAKAQTTEARSAFLPNAYGSLTAVDALSNSRIAAGGLNNPVIYDRYANGVTITQLVTDFGRTSDLAKSADLRSRAQDQVVVFSRADVVLRVDTAYFNALRAQAVSQVADETVRTRQTEADLTSALAANQLKSELDLEFAQVDLAQAKLLQVDARNDVQAAFAELSAALGFGDQQSFTLVDPPPAAAPPTDIAALVGQALQTRPDLAALQLNAQAADQFADAQGDLARPTISLAATTGLIPYRQSTLTDRYAAAGVNVNVPIFTGHLFGALQSEAAAKALAAHAAVDGLHNQIAADVRVAWLAATSAFERLGLTDQLVESATRAAALAESRYQLGLSSIVELSQAQLNLTQAQITRASAHYDYAARLATLAYQTGKRP